MPVWLWRCAFSLDFMQRFKSSSALRINRMLGRTGPFWQSSYHDHAIRSDESLFRHANRRQPRANLASWVESIRAWCRWDDERYQAMDFPKLESSIASTNGAPTNIGTQCQPRLATPANQGWQP
jgi:hypothetical protein